MTEDEVVLTVGAWLRQEGYRVEDYCLGTQKGDDIYAVKGGRKFYFECKGTVSKAGSDLNHWRNASGALFNAIRDANVKRPNDRHGIAVPDGPEFRDLIGDLSDFFLRESLMVLWVSGSENDPRVVAWNIPVGP